MESMCKCVCLKAVLFKLDVWGTKNKNYMAIVLFKVSWKSIL
jgi:hypothetical protein